MTSKSKKTKEHKDAGTKQDGKPEATVEELLVEKAELLGQLQRVSADYANFQKRVPKQISDSVAYQKEQLIRSLIPVLDNLEHTLINAASAENIEILAKGVQIIHDQMLDILKSHDVEQVRALGEMFDPSKHEAMMRRSEADKEDNVVLEEFQKGYMLNGRPIRPSRVIVNKLTVDEPAAVEEAREDRVEEGADEVNENDTE